MFPGAGLVAELIFLFILVLIVRAIFSWFPGMLYTQAGRIVVLATEWYLAPIRRVIPPVGGLDLSYTNSALLMTLAAGLVTLLMVAAAEARIFDCLGERDMSAAQIAQEACLDARCDLHPRGPLSQFAAPETQPGGIDRTLQEVQIRLGHEAFVGCLRAQRPEKPMLFVADPGGEVERVWIAPLGPVAEDQPPQAVDRQGIALVVLQLAEKGSTVGI